MKRSAALSALAALVLVGCGEVVEVLRPRADGSGGTATTGGSPATAGSGVGGGGIGGSGGTTGSPAPNGVSVSAGQIHTCAVKDGALYCWGANQNGQLGVGDVAPHDGPVLAHGPGNVVEVSAGGLHTCYRDADGAVACFGDNTMGQLGSPGPASSEPKAVVLPAKALQLDVNYNHSCAVVEGGKLYCWGENTETQLGQGDAEDSNQPNPVLVATLSNVAQVSCGQGHTVARLETGALYSWGRNSIGDAGLGEGTPTRVRFPTLIPGAADYEQLEVGQDSACAVHAGVVACWGGGIDQHLGNGSEAIEWSPKDVAAPQRFVQVSTDTFHTCAIDDQATLWCFGRGIEGQLGVGDFRRLQPTPASVPGTWRSVSVGRFHTCAVSDENQVACTGQNDTGQLGLTGVSRYDGFQLVLLP